MVIVEVNHSKEFAMTILVLKLPDVKRKTEERPKKCPYCPGETFQRWGKNKKAVRDPRCRTVQVYRYRCCRCRRTFRHYPEGISRAAQTKRLQVLAVLCWTFGMSYRKAACLLSAFHISISHESIWRDAQEQAKAILRRNHWRKVFRSRTWGHTDSSSVQADSWNSNSQA